MRTLSITMLFALAVNACSADPAIDEQQVLRASYALETAGNCRQALAALHPLLIAQPDDHLLRMRQGWLLYQLADHANAIAAYESAASKSPNAVEPRLGQLSAWVALGKWAETERTARLVLKLEPGNSTATRWLAESLLGQGRIRDALEVAERLAERYPTWAIAAELQARSRAAADDKPGAKDAYRRLNRLDPGNAAAAAGLR